MFCEETDEIYVWQFIYFVSSQTKRIADDVNRKRDQYAHYNILPLYAIGVKPAIMELPEVI